MQKLYTITVLTLALLMSCEANNNDEKMEISNKQKVVELLKSIETGASEPIAYINANKYI
ncbi:hypothetical protein [Carboxylicivirga sp. M1479]|uniref:hypothetical protein n=1 Tax=Carboxylicivirga sp. M1479 TaxID=2594476 RepID=UPI001C8F5316|nr:hypothetical protein [Carboxylicivirga sp. M1479]